MRCFDTTFVVDYLSGDDATLEHLRSHGNEDFVVPSIVVYEGVEGVVRSHGSSDVDGFLADIGWADVAQFGRREAVAAGEVQAALADDGSPLSPVDAMIAGTARALGATLVTRDDDLTRTAVAEALDVESY
jgi:predicted nucleic acid-binding protein